MRNKKDTFVCEHSLTTTTCVFPVVLFHNPLIKLLFYSSSGFSPVHILKYKNLFYIVQAEQINPVLITNPLSHTITHQNSIITMEHIINIIQAIPIQHIPFSIVVYTSYTFIHEHFTKKLTEGIIGYYNAKT